MRNVTKNDLGSSKCYQACDGSFSSNVANIVIASHTLFLFLNDLEHLYDFTIDFEVLSVLEFGFSTMLLTHSYFKVSQNENFLCSQGQNSDFCHLSDKS